MIRYNPSVNSKPDGYRTIRPPSGQGASGSAPYGSRPVFPARPGNGCVPPRRPARPGDRPAAAQRPPSQNGGGIFHARVSTATDPGKAAGSVVKALLSGRPAAEAAASGGAVENLGRALGIAQKFAAAHGKRLQVRAEISFIEERESRP
ncbi:hypothetical protein MTAT_26210 [Moorella thermoacetica]|uniref:Uncharacterized protein n=2 Tax=Neomoorella thermoacetica TaxID=1525 RepID=A0AAC9HFJ5_NEOTH|nr:hypothetical protein [Moorella thermoacetica]AOQ23076.1 hypothetical protein Maut_00613 [Moorella thermoacetica]TYL08957.1 hypothetical protein MTAT_26210 [Moorella thermoacetica]